MNDFDTPLPGESPEAFAAFQVYLGMGASRTVDGAYRLAHPRKGRAKGAPGKVIRAPGTWRLWYKKFTWKARAAAYDARGHELAKATREATIITDAAQQAVDRQRHSDRELTLLNGLYEKIEEMMALKPDKFALSPLVDAITAFATIGRLRLAMPYKLQALEESTPPDLFFENDAELEARMADGVVQPMPVDPSAKPEFTPPRVGSNGNGNGHPASPPIPPRPM